MKKLITIGLLIFVCSISFAQTRNQTQGYFEEIAISAQSQFIGDEVCDIDTLIKRAEANINAAEKIGELDNQSYSYVYKVFKKV